MMGNPLTATKGRPLSSTTEQTSQQEKPSRAKNKQTNKQMLTQESTHNLAIALAPGKMKTGPHKTCRQTFRTA